MDITEPGPFAADLAARMHEDSAGIARRWIESAGEQADTSGGRSFPADELLDFATSLVNAVADHIAQPAANAGDAPFIAAARQYSELRFSQDFDASELLTEYTLLGDVLYAFASDTVANTDNGTAAAA
ncbi:MAG: RsbRD N-terminal domain-containing protein, partial [Gemmatimonadetes bacterium]|nr:RsbRD N-terminal domain-containing protein [Gemmatimonadota bacterium]